jgi:hypothetical protein
VPKDFDGLSEGVEDADTLAETLPEEVPLATVDGDASVEDEGDELALPNAVAVALKLPEPVVLDVANGDELALPLTDGVV